MKAFAALLFAWIALFIGPAQATSYQFAVNQSLPPFSYSHGKGQEGLAIEMAQKVFEKAGIEAQIIPMEWTTAQAKAMAGQLDGLIHINKTEDRTTWLLFTGSFLKSDFHVFSRPNQDFEYRSRADLKAKRVAVERNGFAYQQLKGDSDIELLAYDESSEAMSAVAEGIADLYIGDVVVTEFLARSGEAPQLTYHSEPFSEVSSRIAVSPLHPELVDTLNQALEELRLTGEYQHIYAKWDRETVDFLGERKRNAFYLAIAGLLSLLCLVAYLRERTNRVKLIQANTLTKAALANTLQAKKEKEEALELSLNAHKEKEQALKEALEAQKQKDKFMAQITHEFRTPLNTIYGTAKLFIPKDEETREALGKIKKATKHLVLMTSNILMWEKYQSGQIKTNLHIYGLRTLLSELEFSALQSAKATHNTWECKVPRTVPDLLVCDYRLLKHCLENLLDNAFKHTKQGLVSLLVEQSGTSLEFIVADNGVGMSANQIDALARPYYDQFGYENNRDTRGLGLGLATAKGLAQLMNGSLNIASENGVGTIAQLSIPLLSPNKADIDDYKRAQMVLTQKEQKVLTGYTVLIVDDHLLNLEINSNLLGSLGATVYSAADSQTAEKLIAQQLNKQLLFDVIFMDLQMPGIDGFEAIQRIRKQHPNVQFNFVALTACDHDNLMAELNQVGVYEVLHKPFETEDAIRLILQTNSHSLSLTEGILSHIKDDSRY